MIIVCDNTDIADVFYQKISGERRRTVQTIPRKVSRSRRSSTATVSFRTSRMSRGIERTVRIDSSCSRRSRQAGERRRTRLQRHSGIDHDVGKPAYMGEQIRCVVSVSMLTEGWDASNVTHVLGVRAFGSQLLCEQVVGRGLRRMSYNVDPDTGLLPAEYVDVYGIPFSLIPFKGEPKTRRP